MVWQVVTPAEDNLVTWADSYSVYESATAIQSGGLLMVGTSTPAFGGNTYTIAAGRFDNGQSGLGPADFGVQNNDSGISIGGVPMLTGGLSQGATVNSQVSVNPLDAQPVPFADTAFTTAVEQVMVFAAAGVTPGSLLDRRWITVGQAPAAAAHSGVVLGPVLTLDMSTTTTCTIRFVDAANQFELV